MKREQFLRELRKLANDQNAFFEIYQNAGKGSHYRVTFKDKTTTIKSGEITPVYAKLIKKQLGIL